MYTYEDRVEEEFEFSSMVYRCRSGVCLTASSSITYRNLPNHLYRHVGDWEKAIEGRYGRVQDEDLADRLHTSRVGEQPPHNCVERDHEQVDAYRHPMAPSRREPGHVKELEARLE